MNILQVFNGFSDRWNANGYYALSLSEGLKNLGNRVLCMGDPGCAFIEKAKERGLETYELPVDTNNPLRYFPIVKHVRNIIVSENIDIINCHRGMVMAAYIRAARKSGRDVRVIRTHGEPRMPNTHFLSQAESKQIDKFIVTAERLRNYYLKHFPIDTKKIQTIYGAASHEIDEVRTKTQKSQEKKHGDVILGMLGRSSDVKGHSVAIKALKRIVLDKGGKVVLKIAGGKNQERLNELRKTAASLGLSEKNVNVLGYVENIADFISGIDIGIIPSLRSEMICRVLMEFTAFAKPVFGSKVNAVGEVIEKYDLGYTFPPGDDEALAEKVMSAIKDRSVLETFSANSKRAYESTFSPVKLAQETLKFYLD